MGVVRVFSFVPHKQISIFAALEHDLVRAVRPSTISLAECHRMPRYFAHTPCIQCVLFVVKIDRYPPLHFSHAQGVERCHIWQPDPLWPGDTSQTGEAADPSLGFRAILRV